MMRIRCRRDSRLGHPNAFANPDWRDRSVVERQQLEAEEKSSAFGARHRVTCSRSRDCYGTRLLSRKPYNQHLINTLPISEDFSKNEHPTQWLDRDEHRVTKDTTVA